MSTLPCAKFEKNYSQTELEGLSCVWAITHFHQYLWGRRFILYTDHSALTAIFGPKGDVSKLTAVRLQRWAIRLMGYNFEIRYKEGRSNSNADSCRLWHGSRVVILKIEKSQYITCF